MRLVMQASQQAMRKDDGGHDIVQYFAILLPVENGLVLGVPRWLASDLVARGMTVVGDVNPPLADMRSELLRADDDDLHAFCDAHGARGLKHELHCHPLTADLRTAGYHQHADILDDYYRKVTKGEQGTITIMAADELRLHALAIFDKLGT